MKSLLEKYYLTITLILYCVWPNPQDAEKNGVPKYDGEHNAVCTHIEACPSMATMQGPIRAIGKGVKIIQSTVAKSAKPIQSTAKVAKRIPPTQNTASVAKNAKLIQSTIAKSVLPTQSTASVAKSVQPTRSTASVAKSVQPFIMSSRGIVPGKVGKSTSKLLDNYSIPPMPNHMLATYFPDIASIHLTAPIQNIGHSNLSLGHSPLGKHLDVEYVPNPIEAILSEVRSGRLQKQTLLPQYHTSQNEVEEIQGTIGSTAEEYESQAQTETLQLVPQNVVNGDYLPLPEHSLMKTIRSFFTKRVLTRPLKISEELRFRHRLEMMNFDEADQLELMKTLHILLIEERIYETDILENKQVA